MSKLKMVVALLCGVAISAVVFAQQKGGTLSAQDYTEIQQLYARYKWLADMSPGERWAKELFTPDGVWARIDEQGKTVQGVGTQQLAEISVRQSGNLPRNRPQHICVNISIEPSAEGARGRCYLMFVLSQPGKMPMIATMGSYEDIIVKTRAGWRFKKRTVYSGVLPPPELVLQSTSR